jgi:gamma-glutamylcyclotransferase (GGCT)/AIG2-like uncharacterized protein YtfP
MVKVFVYGTLKPGEINYSVCSGQVIGVESAIAYGSLHQLPFGYPAMVPEGDGMVGGVILTFPTVDMLAILDKFEQHDPEKFHHHVPNLSFSDYQYRREEVQTFDIAGKFIATAWSYVMNLEQITALGGVAMPNGQCPPKNRNCSK